MSRQTHDQRSRLQITLYSKTSILATPSLESITQQIAPLVISLLDLSDVRDDVPILQQNEYGARELKRADVKRIYTWFVNA
jgi:hypothetical protein